MPTKNFLNLIFLLTLLCCTASKNGFAQNFRLILKANDSTLLADLKEFNIKKTYLDSTRAIKKTASLSAALKTLGYLDHQLSIQYADSTFIATFTKFSKITTAKIKHNNSDLLKTFLQQKQLKNSNNLLMFPFDKMTSFLAEFSAFLNVRGYAFSSVELQNIQQKKDTLFANLSMALGKQIRINNVVVKGYDEFSQKKLLKLLNFKKNALLNEDLMVSLVEQLKSIPFVEMIRKPELLFTPNATTLYIYLKKRPNSQIDGLVAFSTQENGKLNLNGDLNLRLRNAFDNAEKLQLEWQSSETRRNLAIDLNFPFVFNSKFMLASEFGIQRADSSFVNVDLKTNLGYQFSKLSSLNLSGMVKTSNTSNELNSSNVLDYQKFQFGIDYSLSKKANNHLIENLKTQLTVELQAGTRNGNDQSERQQIFRLIFKHLLTINSRNHIWIRSNNLFLQTNNPLQNELFTIGGFNSLRGFREQEILTSKYSVNNLEYHFLTSEKSYFYGLIDLGIYHQELIKSYETPYTIGLGYVMANQQSLLNFSYAIAKQDNQNFELSNAKFHLKLSYLF